MSESPRIPKAEITGPMGGVMKFMAKRQLGRVPDALEVGWHNRDVLMFSFGLGRKVDKWNACDENLKSFAHMAVASKLGCSACLDFGYFKAHNMGLDLKKAREVPIWRESSLFTALEREVLEYAEAMTAEPTQVTDELSARLLGQLGAPALIELTAMIGLANYFARFNTALGMKSEGMALSCDLPQLAGPISI